MERSWRVLAWNFNHRARQRAIPAAVGEVVAGLDVDILLLNEFVDGPTRCTFSEQLARFGYPHQLVSHRPANDNQVFAASRTPICIGDLAPPTTNSSAIANWLHLRIADSDIELLGLRVPAYTRGTERRAYREQLATILRSAQNRALVVTKDLNEDPFAMTVTIHRHRLRSEGPRCSRSRARPAPGATSTTRALRQVASIT